MAARRANFDLSKFHTYSDVSKLGKVDVKRLASQLNCFPTTLGKKALVNIVCNELNISTCGNNSTRKKRSCIENEIGDEETTWLSYLQKLRNWGKSISSLPENIDIQDVKRFLIGSGFKDEEVKKYKTPRSWEHKQGVHSLRYTGYTCLLMCHYSYCKIKFG